MGSLDNSNRTSVDLESEHATTSDSDESIALPALDHDDSIQLGSNKRLSSFNSCPSSISSDSSLEDQLQDFDTEHDKSSLKLEADDHDENFKELSVDSGAPSSPSSSRSYNSDSPPIQVMERPESSKYRIPSHVFARRNSSTPGDWSMASNDSLFSIQMGGGSFCNPDLGGFGAEAYTPQLSSQFNQFVGEAVDSNELDDEDNMFFETISLDDDKEDQQSTGDQEGSSRLSADSSSSSKSFVFPILAGETEKGSSPHPHGSPMGLPEEPKAGQSPEPTSEAKEETEKATPLVGWTIWFPCFRYCACC